MFAECRFGCGRFVLSSIRLRFAAGRADQCSGYLLVCLASGSHPAKMARAFENVHQFSNDPFSLRLIRSSNGSRQAATQMLFQYGRVYLLDRPLNRQRLLQNVDAIMVISDHSLNGGGVSHNGFPAAENSVCIAVQSDPIPARRKYQASPPGVDKSFLHCLSNDLTKYCPFPGTGLQIVRRRPEFWTQRDSRALHATVLQAAELSLENSDVYRAGWSAI